MSESSRTVQETIASLQATLDGNDAIGTVAAIDHQSNAANIGESLRPTRVTLFGNPMLGTPLMQINQLAGLDLPQKICAWEDEAGKSHIAYRSADYLNSRHGLGDAQDTLVKINNALGKLASAAAGQEITQTSERQPSHAEGIVIVKSANDMKTTSDKLRGALESIDAIKLIAELDHSANASRVGLELAPTTLFIFGNPKLGTPLMLSKQTIGLDLPQKMLVLEDSAGSVSVAYDDPAYLAQMHGINDRQTVIETISNALGNLATAATS